MMKILRIHRKWLVRIANGSPAIDWGEGLAQSLFTRKFFWYTEEEERKELSDEELEHLVAENKLVAYDRRTVSYFARLRE